MKVQNLFQYFAIILIIQSCALDNHEESYSFEYRPLYLTETQNPNKIKLSENGGWFDKYFFIQNDNQILAIKEESFHIFNISGNLINTINLGVRIYNPQISKDKSLVTFIGGIDLYKDLYVVKSDGSGLKKLTDTLDIIYANPTFSNDNSKILFSLPSKYNNLDQDILCQISLDNLIVEKLIDFSTRNNNSDFENYIYGQNGQKIYSIFGFSDDNNEYNRSFASLDLITKQLVEIDKNVDWLSPLATNKQANKIFYISIMSNNGQIHYYDENTQSSFSIAETPGVRITISVTDDGSKMAFGYYYWHNSNEDFLFMVNSDGSNQTKFVKGGRPILSSTGDKLIYTGYIWDHN